MAEIGQILLLPVQPRIPPYAPAARGRGGIAPRTDETADNSQADNSQADNSQAGNSQAGNSAANDFQARRFRFRVHESGDAGAPAAENEVRRPASPVRPRLIDHDVGGGNASNLPTEARSNRKSNNSARFAAGSGSSSAFLAQSIAQEKLGGGLHNPPLAAASAAYTRAGTALSSPPGAGLDISA